MCQVGPWPQGQTPASDASQPPRTPPSTAFLGPNRPPSSSLSARSCCSGLGTQPGLRTLPLRISVWGLFGSHCGLRHLCSPTGSDYLSGDPFRDPLCLASRVPVTRQTRDTPATNTSQAITSDTEENNCFTHVDPEESRTPRLLQSWLGDLPSPDGSPSPPLFFAPCACEQRGPGCTSGINQPQTPPGVPCAGLGPKRNHLSLIEQSLWSQREERRKPPT